MGFLSKLFSKKEVVIRQGKDPRITHVDIPKGMSIKELNATLYRAKLEEEADAVIKDKNSDIEKVMAKLLSKYDESLTLNEFDVYSYHAIKHISKGTGIPKDDVVNMFQSPLNEEMINFILKAIEASKAQGNVEDYNSFVIWKFMQERLKR